MSETTKSQVLERLLETAYDSIVGALSGERPFSEAKPFLRAFGYSDSQIDDLEETIDDSSEWGESFLSVIEGEVTEQYYQQLSRL